MAPRWPSSASTCHISPSVSATTSKSFSARLYYRPGGRRVPSRGRQMRDRRAPWPLETAADKPEEPLRDEGLFYQSVVSPLRYPGAKRQLVPVLDEIIGRGLR